MKFLRKLIYLLLLTIICTILAIVNPIIAFGNGEKKIIPANINRIHDDVKFLTSLSSPRFYGDTRMLDSAAAYISNEFKRLGLAVEEQKYRIDTLEYKNIIASFGPVDAERIIIGAHYDVAGHQPGADDNASGVAGLLELARLLKSEAPTLKKRIDLVAFTLEEPPYFRTDQMGSAVHAKMLHDQGIKVELMISLEMIGFFSEEPKSQQYPVNLMKLFYPTKANFITVVGKLGQGNKVRKIKRGMKRASNLDVRSINAPAFIPGIDFSDHLNYWQYGFNAVMITDTSFYRNNNYHQPTDTIETLNFEKMTMVVMGVYSAIVGIAG